MKVQKLHNVYCQVCLAQGRGQRNEFTLKEEVALPHVSEEQGIQVYQQLKQAGFILECTSCVSSEFDFPAV